MDELSGRTVLDAENDIELPLLPMQGVVLMPGETLPLHIFMPQFVSMMKRCLDGNKTFGVCTIKSDSSGEEYSNVGTTAEIFSVKEDTTGGIHTMTVKATGRQRFQILSKKRQSDRVVVATVRVLPDELLLDRPAVAFACPFELMLAPFEDGKIETGDTVTRVKRNRHMRISDYKVNMLQKLRQDPPSLSPIPSWVYRIYDPVSSKCIILSAGLNANALMQVILMNRVKKEFQTWSQNMAIKHQASNPTGAV
jgi:ATP-dependent Lon protease